MTVESCDVLIVGAGPAGLATATALLRIADLDVVVIEQGSSLHGRTCPVLTSKICPLCRNCDLLRGVGGASGILGGKLCFFPAGGRLATHTGRTSYEANRAVLSLFDDLGYRLVRERLGFPKLGERRHLSSTLSLRLYEALPLLLPELQQLFLRLIDEVGQLGAKLLTRGAVTSIAEGSGGARFAVSYTHKGRGQVMGVRRAVVLAGGRSTAHWLHQLMTQLGIHSQPRNVDVGIRIELPSNQVATLLGDYEDPKIVMNSTQSTEVRTLCWCRGGEMSVTNIRNSCLVDGHFGESFKPFSSVSLVARMPVPDGSNPYDYALSQFEPETAFSAPAHQMLAHFMGTSAFEAAPLPPRPYRCADSDIAKSMRPGLRDGIRGMIEAIDEIHGGGILRHTAGRVFAPVIDNLWSKPDLNADLMTTVPNLYLAGDVTGLGRGIIQAIYSGLVVASAVAIPENARIATAAQERLVLTE